MTSRIAPNHLHIWLVSINEFKSHHKPTRFLKLLSKSEIEKYSRFVLEKDRERFLITRVLARTVLSDYIKAVTPATLRFTKNAHGKPEIASELRPYPLTFNISHSEDLIALAVASEEAIGLDIEMINPELSTHELANRVFSEQEYLQLESAASACFCERFFELWTLKEAYLKALGMGLTIPLKSFTFLLPGQDRVGIKFTQNHGYAPDEWAFWMFKPSENYTGALALKSHTEHQNYELMIRDALPTISNALITPWLPENRL